MEKIIGITINGEKVAATISKTPSLPSPIPEKDTPAQTKTEYEFAKVNGFIAYREINTETWINIVSINDLKPDTVLVEGGGSSTASNIELQKGTTHIQWKLESESTWKNLIAIEDITGDDGLDGDVGNISDYALKNTPEDNDLFLIEDSAIETQKTKKSTSLSNLKTLILSWVGLLYSEESIITLYRSYTTPNNNSLKQLFDSPANGAFNARENTTYFFECQFTLSSMSTSSGNFSFGILGTATITFIEYIAFAGKSSSSTTTALTTVASYVNTTAATALMTNNTNTSGWCRVTGKIVVSNSGTIIPAFGTSQAAATIVRVGAFFKIWKAGANDFIYKGDFT